MEFASQTVARAQAFIPRLLFFAFAVFWEGVASEGGRGDDVCIFEIYERNIRKQRHGQRGWYMGGG